MSEFTVKRPEIPLVDPLEISNKGPGQGNYYHIEICPVSRATGHIQQVDVETVELAKFIADALNNRGALARIMRPRVTRGGK